MRHFVCALGLRQFSDPDTVAHMHADGGASIELRRGPQWYGQCADVMCSSVLGCRSLLAAMVAEMARSMLTVR
jgi:hypothetical protein